MRFVIRLALHCGRADWLQFWHELTPFEYEYLKAFNAIESFGDDREDARVKHMTYRLIEYLRMAGEMIEPSDLEYIRTDDAPKKSSSASPTQAAMMWRAVTGGR